MLLVEKIKEDFMGRKNLAKVTLLEEVSTNNKHLLPTVLSVSFEMVEMPRSRG